jgi:hypothetical protein
VDDWLVQVADASALEWQEQEVDPVVQPKANANAEPCQKIVFVKKWRRYLT